VYKRQVQDGDNQGVNIEASNITLTDKAGNVSGSASSTGSSLSVDTTPPPPPVEAPTVASVIISPNSGYAMVADTVTITVTAGGNEAGLTPSNAAFNGKQVPLTDKGDGTYVGVYSVMEGDNDGINVEATNITFTGSGGTSSPASSSGSTLKIDAHTPSITSVTINPNSGWIKTGEIVTVTVFASNNEADLTTSDASINGKYISLTDQGDGTYRGSYTVQASDAQGVNIEAVNITLTDAAGNVSNQASSTGSTLIVDTQAPGIVSVTISPDSGWITAGDSVVVIVTASNNETGLTTSGTFINGKLIPLTDQSDGKYTGTYTVQAADSQGVNIEASGITLTDAAGNVSTAGTSSGSTLKVDTQAPTIASVTISPNTGTVTTGNNVIIIVTAGGNETDLTASNTQINGRSIQLIDQGNGTYTGIYIVQTGDNQGTNIEAANVTLTDRADNVSGSASSTGSSLSVDTTPPPPPVEAPTVASVIISPNSGYAMVGDTVTITVTAGGNEAGLTPSNATINVKQVSLSDRSDGTYAGIYIVMEGDNDGSNVEATNITLTGAGGTSAVASSSGSTLKIDGHKPTVASVMISPGSGTVTIGDTVVIFVTAGGNEAGLIASNAEINGNSIQLNDLGGGSYIGLYIVQSSDPQSDNVEVTGITLTDSAGNVSNPASATSSLRVLTQPSESPVAFIDEDLDIDDPFIIRDADSLFVADNDDSLTFTWNSWQAQGAVEYRVNVYSGTFENMEFTVTITDTSFTFKGDPGKTYSVEVIPRTINDEPLTILKSRVILCTAEKPGAPGKPTHIIKKD